MPPSLPETELSSSQQSRLNHTLGPVAAGMILDGIDILTFGPVGLALGFPIGAVAGYWLGQSLGLDKRVCWFCAILAGAYCMLPFTAVLPLGTLVGAYARYKQDQPPTAKINDPPLPPLLEHHDDPVDGGPSA